MLIPTETELKSIAIAKEFPITLAWSRLEGRPRGHNFDRALRAEVRDALWMLTRQWQMGEFEGDDAGSPVVAKLCTSTAVVDKYRAGERPVQPLNQDEPFEAKVEQRALPLATLAVEISLDLRLIMGRRWLQLLGEKGLLTPALKQFFLKHYGIKKPDPEANADAAICAHLETWQAFAAVAGRMVDGARLFLDFASATHYYDLPDFPAPGDHSAFDEVEAIFSAWYGDLFYQPADAVNDAWAPSRLEYQFAISANTESGEKVMEAEQYYQGHLDWYNVDVNPAPPRWE